MPSDVQPVLADQVGGDRPARGEQHPDEVRRVEVAVARDEADHVRREHVDPRVDRELLARLLLHRQHAAVVQRELAVRQVDLVQRHAHRHAGAGLRAVVLPHRAEVALREDVAVDDEERRRRRRRQQGERAHRAARLGLQHVPDADAESRAVAEALADHVGLVMQREHNIRDPRLPQPLDEDLEQRLAPDAEQRLGRVVGERPQPLALAAGHDHRAGGQRRRLEQLLLAQQIHDHVIGTEHRQVPHAARAHQRQRRLAPEPRPRRHRRAVHRLVDLGGERQPAQQRAAQVAVGHQTGQPPLPVHDEADLLAAAREHGERVTQRGALAHADVGKRRHASTAFLRTSTSPSGVSRRTRTIRGAAAPSP